MVRFAAIPRFWGNSRDSGFKAADECSRVRRLDRAGQARRALWRSYGCCTLLRLLPSLLGAAALIAVSAPPVHAASVDRECRAGKPDFRGARDWNGRRLEIGRLTDWQSFRDSVSWRLNADGILTERGPVRIRPRERYRLRSVPKAWRKYGGLIRAAARRYHVPAELFLTIIVNESALDPRAYKTYRGYVSDRKTPDRISIGLGQILISTARFMLRDPSIDRAWLENPANNIRMIGIYLNRQYRLTGFDPPKVAAAYNAGGLYRQNGPANHWKMRNYPVGRSVYIDLFVAVFDEAMRYLASHPRRPRESFAALFARDSIVAACAQAPGFRSSHPWARASVRQPLAHKIGDVVLASDGNAGRRGLRVDYFTRLSRHQRARISLQSRISGRFPDDPDFRAAPVRRRAR